MQDDIDPDILGARKKKWNSSVFVEKKEKDHEAELFKVRKGFLDESITDPRDQLVYQGTEVRNDYTGWNVSIEVPLPLERERIRQE